MTDAGLKLTSNFMPVIADEDKEEAVVARTLAKPSQLRLFYLYLGRIFIATCKTKIPAIVKRASVIITAHKMSLHRPQPHQVVQHSYEQMCLTAFTPQQ